MTRRYRPFDPFERGGPFEPREIRIPRPPRRFWVGLGLFGLALVIFFIASPIVWFFTELQWYDSLGFKDVFTTRFSLQVALLIGGFALAFIYLVVNVIIALRVRAGPSLRSVGIRRSSIRGATAGAALGGAALVALVLSGGAGTQWQNLAMFQHARPTGITDPVLGQDVSWGAAYTDVNARLPIVTFLSGAAVVLAGALLVNVWLRRLWLPVTAALVWVALLLIGQIYPAVVQTAFTTPNAQTYELPYINREIAGTRAAYGLSNVTVSNFTGDQPLTLANVQNDQVTVNNLRLWDFPPLKDTYEQQQTIRTYYTFYDIGIDRYTINNQPTSLEISAREFDFNKLPDAAKNWVNQHLQYTHGYGVAASPVNAVDSQGLPVYVVGDIPPNGQLPITQPAIYFGEVTTGYALAPNTNREFDYPSSPDVYTSYTGTHGVPMTAVNRALWSLKLGDFNLLVSGQVTDKTLMLYRRQIIELVGELAPFLSFDSQPYVVVVDGRIYWIVDAYTTGATYPYSQAVPFQNGKMNINYIRNSVKV